ncbi:hypothetical protein BH10BAC1_BH10BAC1_09140 [soil metagenome]
MKTKIITFILGAFSAFSSTYSSAQTTATPYNFIDCNGNPQSLFADLDAGNAVILEFFMTSCSPCIAAGQTLEVMKADLLSEFPGKIKAYAFGFSDTYTCGAINSWVTTNGITSIPSDSGAYQVAYYGGMGMPTIVILGGGSSHSVLGAPYLSYTTSDTTTMAADIRNFLNTASVSDFNNVITKIKMYPNPGNDLVKLSFELKESADIQIDLLDVSGRRISAILDKKNQSGAIVESFNTSVLANGSYVISIKANGIVTQQKLNVIH